MEWRTGSLVDDPLGITAFRGADAQREWATTRHAMVKIMCSLSYCMPPAAGIGIGMTA